MVRPYSHLVLSLLAGLSAFGCVERPIGSEQAAFEESKLSSVCAVLIDLSGSFRKTLDERAYRLFLEIADRHATASMGQESKLIVGQLSAQTDQIVLFEGSPGDFRKRFRSAAEFIAFLKGSSDPKASHVLEATTRSLEYLTSVSGETPKTRMTLVVLSDMRESQRDPAKRAALEAALQTSLRDFRAKGGAIAFYHVAEQERERWYRRLKECDFTPADYVVEGEVSESPRLPIFD